MSSAWSSEACGRPAPGPEAGAVTFEWGLRHRLRMQL
ncbi:hypothetical protein CGRA01v4_00823 [Colletotrichum graminicola]|nr:hypothetical protein CGRA01v4_00823 [Colletotrichum graminicola]